MLRPVPARLKAIFALAVRMIMAAVCVFVFIWIQWFRGVKVYHPDLRAGGRLAVPFQGAVSVVGVGDMMMGSRAQPVIEVRGSDYPFEALSSLILSADAAVGNLEAPFTASGTPFEKTFTFRVPCRYALGLKNAGFDVLTLANNHILDFGPSGLFSTLDILDSLEIAHCGAGQDRDEAEGAVVIRKAGWSIAFLAFSLTYPEEFWAGPASPGTAFYSAGRAKERIEYIRDSTDLIVVSFHWGKELNKDPEPYQRETAHAVIDWGADLVLGHHPHSLQGLELYKGRLIAYSLGNFVFGAYSQSVRESVVLEARFDRQGLLYARIVPISVYNDSVAFRPIPLEGQDRLRILDSLNVHSVALNGGKKILDASGILLPEPTLPSIP
jgi:poly-gamma-glutamate capsule biosynthesis protein CapA/YwtB (metallophosphatase superfamily)